MAGASVFTWDFRGKFEPEKLLELLARPDSPARVVIDEAIEIARRYGSEESGRFVNGVLDPVARALRP